MAYAANLQWVTPRPPLSDSLTIHLESTSGRVGEPVSQFEIDSSTYFVRTNLNYSARHCQSTVNVAHTIQLILLRFISLCESTHSTGCDWLYVLNFRFDNVSRHIFALKCWIGMSTYHQFEPMSFHQLAFSNQWNWVRMVKARMCQINTECMRFSSKSMTTSMTIFFFHFSIHRLYQLISSITFPHHHDLFQIGRSSL